MMYKHEVLNFVPPFAQSLALWFSRPKSRKVEDWCAPRFWRLASGHDGFLGQVDWTGDWREAARPTAAVSIAQASDDLISCC